MQRLISTQLLTQHMKPEYYGPFMAPYFAVHAKYSIRSPGLWAWADPGAVEECLSSTWDMLGQWLARRATKVDRTAFDALVPRVVSRVAKVLTRHQVRSLHDLGKLNVRPYQAVVGAIQDGVMEVSALKATKNIEPMFGSKTLHHYFPSVVPVFDTAMVRNGAMRVKAFAEFLDEKASEWLVWHDANGVGGASALDFHRFLGFCTTQVTETTERRLAQTRQALGAAVQDFAPAGMARDRASYLWCLDAKLAEFCACGQAVVEGHRQAPASAAASRDSCQMSPSE